MSAPTRRPDTERAQERRRRGAHQAVGDRRGLEGGDAEPGDHEPAARPFAGRRYMLGTLHPDTAEMVELCETLGLVHLADVVQVRDKPRPGTFFGSGKVRALRAWIDELHEGRIPSDWLAEGDHWVAMGESEASSGGDRAEVWLSVGDDDTVVWDEPHDDDRRHGRDRGEDGTDVEDDTDDTWETLRSDPSLEISAPGHRAPRRSRTKAKHEPRKGRADLRDEGRPTGHPSVSTGTFGPGRPAAGREAEEGTAYDKAHPRTEGNEVPPVYDPASDPDLLLVLDEDVKPSVLFNLEDRLGIEVWDRTRLILEIFSAHAHVKEAKLQVELAKLQYEVPLMREAIHRKRSGERPGFGGGGEYDVADYQEFIKRRMRTLKEELERIRRERGVRRQVRREGFYLVSLAGYTNAGKSTLLNTLTGSEVQSEWTMFSTLATTTRRLVDPRPAPESAQIARGDDRAVDQTRTRTSSYSAGRREKTPAKTDMSSKMGDPMVSSGGRLRGEGESGGVRSGSGDEPGPSARADDARPADRENGRQHPGRRAQGQTDHGRTDQGHADQGHADQRETDGDGANQGAEQEPGQAQRQQPGQGKGLGQGLGQGQEHGQDVGVEDPPTTDPPLGTGSAGPENRYQRPVLVTDTVGFIQGLPSWLLEAFHSTLEEIGVSDVVLLVVDISDPIETMVEKVRVCKEELAFLDVTCPVLVVLNKVDLVPEPVWQTRKRAIVAQGLAAEKEILTVSCADATGLGALRDRIDASLPSYVRYRITLPYDGAGQRILSHLYKWGWVHDVSYGKAMEAEGSCDRLHWQEMLRETQEAGVPIERI